MKLGFFIFVFAFLLLPFAVSAGDISGVVFESEPQTVMQNEVALLTIQLEYSGDSHPTACMQMSSDSGTGQFSSNETNWSSVDKLTINSNWSKRNFYYKDSTAGTFVITVKIVSVSCSVLTDEEAEWVVSQNIIVSDGSGTIEEVDSGQDSAQVIGGGQSEYTPPEELPRIKADAGENRVLVAGSRADFRGRAFGFENEPLNNARYVWNFGDGSVHEGQNITHFYRYPGEYVLVLNVSSGEGEPSATDRISVKVIPGEIYISEIKTGVDSFIEFYNATGEEINLHGWRFRADYQNYFTFAENTFIKPAGYLAIPSLSSGIIFPQGRGIIEFLYPGGLVADSFEYQGVLGEGQSFSRQGEKIFVSAETPGLKNEEFFLEVELESQPRDAGVKQDAGVKFETGVGDRIAETAKSEEVGFLDNQAMAGAAGVMVATNNGGESEKKWLYYFLPVLGLVLLAGFGVVFIRRKGGV